MSMKIPKQMVEEAIAAAALKAMSSGKKQFVRIMTWDLYSSIGFSDQNDLNVGRLYAEVHPDGTIDRQY